MSGTHAGSCLCGAVRFEVKGELEHFYLCHCGYCRKDSGSAHAASLVSTSATVSWIAGRDRVTGFTLPSTRHSRCFCSVCGSALPCEQGAEGMLIVPAGSLDTKVPLRPDANIFMASRASWDDDLAQIPSLDGLPH